MSKKTPILSKLLTLSLFVMLVAVCLTVLMFAFDYYLELGFLWFMAILPIIILDLIFIISLLIITKIRKIPTTKVQQKFLLSLSSLVIVIAVLIYFDKS